MFTLADTFWTSKTTWVAIGTILTTLWAVFHHQVSWHDAAIAIFAALQTMNLRDIIAKNGQSGVSGA